MKYRVQYSKTAQKEIKKLSPQIKTRIKAKLEFFYSLEEPLDHAEILTKPRDAEYRWRVGVFRILFDCDGDTITIIRIQHRKEVYRK